MKISVIMATGYIVLGACTTWADQPIPVAEYSFVTYSATSNAYGVQTVLSTTASNWSMRTRFQVFDTSSGNLLWQSDTNYGWSSQVHLAPDPNYIVCVNTYFTTMELDRRSGWPVDTASKITDNGFFGIVRSVNTNYSEKVQENFLDDTWALRIYKRDQLLRSYSLTDLNFPFVYLEFSASHGEFTKLSTQFVPIWTDDPYESRLNSNPNPRFSGNQVILDCLDGMARVFDLKKGILIETKETERLQHQPAP